MRKSSPSRIAKLFSLIILSRHRSQQQMALPSINIRLLLHGPQTHLPHRQLLSPRTRTSTLTRISSSLTLYSTWLEIIRAPSILFNSLAAWINQSFLQELMGQATCNSNLSLIRFIRAQIKATKEFSTTSINLSTLHLEPFLTKEEGMDTKLAIELELSSWANKHRFLQIKHPRSDYQPPLCLRFNPSKILNLNLFKFPSQIKPFLSPKARKSQSNTLT